MGDQVRLPIGRVLHVLTKIYKMGGAHLDLLSSLGGLTKKGLLGCELGVNPGRAVIVGYAEPHKRAHGAPAAVQGREVGIDGQDFQGQINGLKTDLANKDAQLKQAQQAAADAQAAADKAKPRPRPSSRRSPTTQPP